MPLPFIIPAALGAAQAGFGLYQNIKGNKILNNTERPEYQIPDEIYQNLTEAQKMALEGLPAEQKEQYLQSIDRGASTALTANASRKGGLSSVNDIMRSQTDAYSTLLTQDATARMQNQQAAMAQRQSLANYKDKAFQYNQDEPYRQNLAEGQALVGSGLQNMWGGLSGVGGAAMGALNYNQMTGSQDVNGQATSENLVGSNVNNVASTNQAYGGQMDMTNPTSMSLAQIMQYINSLPPEQQAAIRNR